MLEKPLLQQQLNFKHLEASNKLEFFPQKRKMALAQHQINEFFPIVEQKIMIQ